ncbi:unnamed protein product, partial [Ectocarpus sp. 4 AP-2014]
MYTYRGYSVPHARQTNAERWNSGAAGRKEGKKLSATVFLARGGWVGARENMYVVVFTPEASPLWSWQHIQVRRLCFIVSVCAEPAYIFFHYAVEYERPKASTA